MTAPPSAFATGTYVITLSTPSRMLFIRSLPASKLSMVTYKGISMPVPLTVNLMVLSNSFAPNRLFCLMFTSATTVSPDGAAISFMLPSSLMASRKLSSVMPLRSSACTRPFTDSIVSSLLNTSWSAMARPIDLPTRYCPSFCTALVFSALLTPIRSTTLETFPFFSNAMKFSSSSPFVEALASCRYVRIASSRVSTTTLVMV